MSDGGKDRSTDVIVESLSKAILALEAMIDQQPPDSKWTFPHTPLDDFGATRSDLLGAFCKWAREVTRETKSTLKTSGATRIAPSLDWSTTRINVTKAFRRLTSYVLLGSVSGSLDYLACGTGIGIQSPM
jgi:hypothetical protein